jgi:MoxR-like ATPase
MKFKFIKGPVFSNIILADEINRSKNTAEACKRSVTIAGENYKLDLPYFVLATQNPIEQEVLSLVDRFMFAIKLRYPSFAEEVQVVKTRLQMK